MFCYPIACWPISLKPIVLLLLLLAKDTITRLGEDENTYYQSEDPSPMTVPKKRKR